VDRFGVEQKVKVKLDSGLQVGVLMREFTVYVGHFVDHVFGDLLFFINGII
jgi:hypothetical protein